MTSETMCIECLYQYMSSWSLPLCHTIRQTDISPFCILYVSFLPLSGWQLTNLLGHFIGFSTGKSQRFYIWFYTLVYGLLSCCYWFTILLLSFYISLVDSVHRSTIATPTYLPPTGVGLQSEPPVTRQPPRRYQSQEKYKSLSVYFLYHTKVSRKI